MRRTVMVIALLLVALSAALLPAAVITVDDDGGADYTVIQDAVDAASSGDTVLVHPGTYTDRQNCSIGLANVCVYKDLVLRSFGGPEVTVIDGAGMTTNGVCVAWDYHAIVEGFTISNSGRDGGWYAAVELTKGEVRGNIIRGYTTGVSTETMWYAAGDVARMASRNTLVIEDNDIDCHETGIYLNPAGLTDAEATGNTIGGCGWAGIEVDHTGSTRLIGNEISGSRYGVFIDNPSHNPGAMISVEVLRNRIVDNTETNVLIGLYEIAPGSDASVVIGGAPQDANDIHGAPMNLRASVNRVRLELDATYNYWGSVACTTLVPLFDIDEDIPDTAFVFEPFFDEPHLVTYDCQGVPVQESSWGAIKALYR